MKTRLHLKFALLLLLVFPLVVNSQFTDPERDTRWNIGFNMGGVWQDGDIKLDRPGFGYGFTIGKGIYEDPGKFWSVDARFRYMKGFTFGQDVTRLDSADMGDNTIYSSNPSNYKNSLGYTYLNSKTMIHDFSLEGVVNFHMLRERTGVILSVFGGIGVTDYKTTTNLLDNENFNKIYNYAQLNQNDLSKSEIKDLLDGEYETRALYNSSDDKTVKFMPSLGIALGYQITPKWSFGFEHKVTFALHDKFDGIQKEGTQFLQWGDNDKYHYSSVFLRLNIFRGEDNSDPISEENCPPPYLKIADIPNNYVVNEQLFSVNARVTKINSNNDVILVSNDQMIQTSYNNSTDYVSGDIMLVEGENKILFIATNTCGESMDSVVVIYNPEFCPKAVITITEPEAIVGESKTTLSAKVLQLQGGTLQVKLNNSVIPHNYNENTLVLTADMNLNVGANTVSIQAINKCGDTTVFKNIEYKCIAPTVVINSPENGKQYESQSNQANFSATATNVYDINQVEVRVNGVQVTSSFNKETGVIAGTIIMNEGSNTVSVKVTNDCGTQTKTTQFVYVKPCLLPVVSFTAPSNNQNITTSSVTVSANVTNITSNSNVRMRVNGVVVASNFSNGSLSTVVNLRLGANVIELSGVNVCGTDSETINITYNCPKPIVSITSPANGTGLNSGNTTITGSVANVTSQSQVNVTVNGSSIPFTFNTSSRTYSAPVNLNTGQNVIVVTANTTCGSDSKTSVVNVSVPCPSPSVTISNPSNGSNLSNSAVTIYGSAVNVNYQSEMRVTLNGVNQSFNYNAGSRTFSSSMNLASGNNTIMVSATTSCGTDSKSINVSYNAPCPAPVVSISSPSNGTSVTSGSLTLNGSAVNVNNQSEVRVTLNGVNQAFSYNYSSKQFTSNLNLQEGNNTILVTATTSCGTDTKTVNVTYTKSCPAPVVSISSPRNGLNSSSNTVSFTGIVQNVTSSSQITLKLNGAVINKSFNSTTKIVSATLNLNQGSNTIELSSTNNCGTDSKVISVSYRCPLATVNIASPNTGMKYTTNPITFSGFVSGVSAKSQITVSLNGSPVTFNYDAATSKFSGSINLIEGSNTLTASVTNQCGTVNNSSTVTYTKPCPKPTVTILNPSNGAKPTDQYITINGTTTNVTSQSQLKLTLNGAAIPFTFNASNNTFTTTYDLSEGNNVIVATVTNDCGTQMKTVTIGYTKPCPKPTVTILNPSNGAKPTDQYITINGTTTNVTSQSQLKLTLNGIAIPFTFNASNNTFTTTYDLSEGNNVIVATVTNDCGTQTKTVTVGYTKPCPKPTVTILNPSNGAKPTDQYITINGTTTNVTSQSQLKLTLNGTAIPFTFNASNNTFTTTYDLSEGNNVIVATVTNDCGTQTKTVTIGYTKPCPKPTVTISSPLNGSVTTTGIVTIRGSVTNVSSSNEISVVINNTKVNHTYNSSTKQFEVVRDFVNTSNVIVVTVTNSCGSVSKTINVSYTPPCPKPTVTIASPINGATITGNSVTITGVAEDISSQVHLQVRLNGVAQTVSYNSSNGAYSAVLTLKEGVNTIYAGVATACGNNAKTITVTSVWIKPIINIYYPLADTSTTSESVLKLNGEVQKISSQAQLTINVNGSFINDFTFNKIANEKYAFNSLLNLKQGANVITVTAVHPSGTIVKKIKVVNVVNKFVSPEGKGNIEIERGSSTPMKR